MNNVTRNYYVPKNQVGRYLINRIIEKIDCSVDNIKVNHESETLRVTLSFQEKDAKTVERILKMYGLM